MAPNNRISRPSLMVRSVVLAATLAIGIGIGQTTFASEEAAAHLAANYYDRDWVSNPSVRLGNLDNDLDGNWNRRNQTQARTNTAIAQWNNVDGPMDFGSTYWNISTVWTGSSCSTALYGNLTIVSYSISPLGITNRCTTSSAITRSAIRIDYRTWGLTFGTPPSGTYDYQSTITHELGHGTGWGDGPLTHLAGTTTCPGSNDWGQNTMCSGQVSGTSMHRTLEGHDKHTFDDAG